MEKYIKQWIYSLFPDYILFINTVRTKSLIPRKKRRFQSAAILLLFF